MAKQKRHEPRVRSSAVARTMVRFGIKSPLEQSGLRIQQFGTSPGYLLQNQFR
jgi:hypothetical protein